MGKIKGVKILEIIASGGMPSLQCEIETEKGLWGRASVAYGVSAGSLEAAVLTDKASPRFGGRGMEGVGKRMEEVVWQNIVGLELEGQMEIDQRLVDLDGTPLKTRLGGNALLSVSLAVARAASLEQNLPLYQYLQKVYGLEKTGLLPKPMIVAIEGGKHADNSTDVQEYLLSVGFSQSVLENVRVGLEIYSNLKKILKEQGFSTNTGNEGAFAPEGIESDNRPMDFLVEAIERAGYKPGHEVFLSLDVAANELIKNQRYCLRLGKEGWDGKQMLEWYSDLIKKYPLLTLEDPFAEEDWENWSEITKKLGGKLQIIADDLTVSRVSRLEEAIKRSACNGVLIKLNQAGTLSETVATCKLAKKHNLMIIPSHRGGGETNDTFMVDLAVAVGADFIKVGPTRGERVEKYNRLMEIEREMEG